MSETFAPCRTCWIINQHLDDWHHDTSYWILHQLLLERKWKLESDIDKLDWIMKSPAEKQRFEIEQKLLLSKMERATQMARKY